MLLWNKMSFIDRGKKISEEILNWSIIKESFLSVTSVPYNSTKIFIEIIELYIRQNKSVIYITNEEPYNVSIIKNIKEYTELTNYIYIRKPQKYTNSKLKICNFQNAVKLKEKFQLIIYDDISSFSTYNKYEIFDLIDKLTCRDSKIIIYSIENIFKHAREVFMPIRNGIQIVEPRIILTRLNINKEIPFVVYDYLKWSIDIGKKAIIYVPDEEKLENVYFYIYNYCKNFSENIIHFSDGKSDRKLISEFLHAVNAILITNCLQEIISNTENCDVMAYFADDPKFDYKKFVYLCGSRNIGKDGKNLKEEVILVANLESKHMEKARIITRDFNRKAWKMGLLGT
ncbi:hypothetical protein ACJDU8_17480 [Clostridium sp. WILCCON 0269]|uniref:Competence protein ComF n=1 Tax=Candidatus Clostridium eludens TaxID=3381663 RepID=A0ABW8SMQ7_9CLOT